MSEPRATVVAVGLHRLPPLEKGTPRSVSRFTGTRGIKRCGSDPRTGGGGRGRCFWYASWVVRPIKHREPLLHM
jgi:hypothetical protein